MLRWLRLGTTQQDDTEVLSGLSAGETIIVPSTGVHDGVAITTIRGV